MQQLERLAIGRTTSKVEINGQFTACSFLLILLLSFALEALVVGKALNVIKMESPRARFMADGDSSRGSPALPGSQDLYPDLANKWAANAYPSKAKGTVYPCVQLSLYVLGLSAVMTLVGVYCWADRKLATAQAVLEPRVMEERTEMRCEAPEDFVDYAAARNGALVLVEDSSPSYHGLLLVWTIQEAVGGLNSLQYLIDSDNSKSRCWAFEGSQGYATVRLGKPVFPRQFALFHAPVTFTQLLRTYTAPRRFSLYRISPDSKDLLGSYVFDAANGLQYFPCQDHCFQPLAVVRLEIEDNYGDPNVTCVYQLRVHGLPVT